MESGLGQEAVEEVGPVLHPPAPGLHVCAVSWLMLCLMTLASDRLKFDQAGSTGFSSLAYGGSW
jgi:hypothetical protein